MNVSITVRELLGDRIAAAFDGMTLVRHSDGTQLVGRVIDHAQLYGLLTRVRDLGLELTSVVVTGAEHVNGRRRNGMFEVTARLKIRDGQIEGFMRQAAEMMRLTRELDTRTVRYDWFLSADRTEVEVREAYVDADGLVEHAFHVKEAREELFREYAYDHDMTIYGEPSPKLAELLERLKAHVAFNQFSRLQEL